MHTMVRALLTEIEAFLAETGLTPTKFGLASVNDGHLVANLRRGNSVTLKTADRVRAFMRASAPAPRAGRGGTDEGTATARACPDAGERGWGPYPGGRGRQTHRLDYRWRHRRL